jgi:hypothetical protein
VEDEADRLIIHLTVAGQTQAEVGAELGLSQQTISYRLQRLKNNFAERLVKPDSRS